MGPQRAQALGGAGGDALGGLGVLGGVVELDVGRLELAHVVLREGGGDVLVEAGSGGRAAGEEECEQQAEATHGGAHHSAPESDGYALSAGGREGYGAARMILRRYWALVALLCASCVKAASGDGVVALSCGSPASSVALDSGTR